MKSEDRREGNSNVAVSTAGSVLFSRTVGDPTICRADSRVCAVSASAVYWDHISKLSNHMMNVREDSCDLVSHWNYDHCLNKLAATSINRLHVRSDSPEGDEIAIRGCTPIELSASPALASMPYATSRSLNSLSEPS